MKPSFSRWVACGVATAVVLGATIANAAVGRAVVTRVTGQADYAEQGGDWQTLREGKVLGPGSTVRTGVGSVVDLFLGDNGPAVRLTEETTLGLDRLNIERTGGDLVIETLLDLQRGTIRGVVKQLSPASKYEVKTPNTVMGVRATEGMTEYQISAEGVHHVIDGAVVVVYNNPATRAISTHTVNAGQTFMPPPQPGAPQAVPEVRPTPPDVPIVAPPDIPPVIPGTPVVVVPEPVTFISPGTGAAAGGD